MTNEEVARYFKELIECADWVDASYIDSVKVEAIRSAIEELEDSRWIPVSERLPEKEGEYLVTKIDHRNISVVTPCYYNIEWDWSTGYEVTAWMPLPKPYKEGAEE